MKKVLTFLLLLSVNLSVCAGEWYPVGVDAEKAMFIDKSTIAKSGNQRQAWVWNVYAKPKRGSDNMKFMWTLDCQNRKYKTEHISRYLGSKFIDSTNGDNIFEQVVPDTVGSQIWEIVCKNTFQEPYLDTVDVVEVQKIWKKSKGSRK